MSWDKWNYARSETQLDAVSARYVSPGTYGVRDLDRYGTWRVVPTYGSVWVPTAVQPGWAPYTTGSWTFDPVLRLDLGRHRAVGLGALSPRSLGLRERLTGAGRRGRWWRGRCMRPPSSPSSAGPACASASASAARSWAGWRSGGASRSCPGGGGRASATRPSWGGWGGPRVVNNVVINNTTVVNVQNINVYRNTTVQNAVVVVNENRFGRGPITRRASPRWT